MALLNYNRSVLTNEADSFVVVLNGLDQLILEFGLFVSQAQNFIELLATIGWEVTNTSPLEPDQATIVLTIRQDDVVVATVNQESIENGADEDLEMVTTLQALLTNVPVGHHVYQLYARNIQTAQGDITITGPANISGKVIS